MKNKVIKHKKANSRFYFENKFIKMPKSKRSTRAFNQLFNIKCLPDSKRSQHEALGFVLIVALVIIIIVIFLGLSAGKGDMRQNSIEISNLLQASIYYTSDCAINFIPQYEDVQGLISACYKNPEQKCLDGKNVCQALNETLKNIIEKSLNVDPASPNKAYKLNIYYSPLNNVQDKEMILYLSQGIFNECKSKPGGSYSLPAGTFSSSTINIELELCRG